MHGAGHEFERQHEIPEVLSATALGKFLPVIDDPVPRNQGISNYFYSSLKRKYINSRAKDQERGNWGLIVFFIFSVGLATEERVWVLRGSDFHQNLLRAMTCAVWQEDS